MASSVIYTDSECNTTPTRVFLSVSENCTTKQDPCSMIEDNGGPIYRTDTCVDPELQPYIANFFGESPYVTLEYYTKDGCETLKSSSSFQVTSGGTCTRGGLNASARVELDANGSAQLKSYNTTDCGGEAESPFSLSSETIANHTCVQERYKFYSSISEAASTGNSGSSGNSMIAESISTPLTLTPSPTTSTTEASSSVLSVGGIVGVVVGCLALLLVVVGLIFWRRSVTTKRDQAKDVESPVDQYYEHTMRRYSYATETSTRGSSLPQRPSSMPGGLWDDEAIAAVRIPREKVVIDQLISRGGFGEVYKGSFNDQVVAVKMLLPETRKNMRCVTEFCAEVKLMSSLDHPRIARFVGVAWDSLADLCVLSEFMDGGDLRSFLDQLEKQQYPVGFNHDKVKIALHVAHALTYLHSLAPPVIHRDLKSKNVLLSSDLDAKLTDFGISRVQINQMMTAGVGSSLWMAPEVMMGHQYDDKADVFSFGVVLSELDSHSLPYANAADRSNSGRKLNDAAILQLVASGNLHVEFSRHGSEAMARLGLACVSVDPKDRPTAAEALYNLQVILSRM
ncbi:hypothetical protein BBJ28_00025355 [Nothophytophthora sp. Chile5]|nr:hypothetical protein BBJ28_00025355 [Nothophytophthora sp. Chile5]